MHSKPEPTLNFLLTFGTSQKRPMNKKVLSFAFLICCITLLSAQITNTPENTDSVTTTITQGGIGLGSVIAVVASWDRNRSILWAIIHGLLSWVYVIYFALTGK